MNTLTRADIRRWLRNGKSIKCGDTWFTIARTSHVREGFAIATAEWEVRKGKKPVFKIVTYEDILKNVNEGNWLVYIQGNKKGLSMTESVSKIKVRKLMRKKLIESRLRKLLRNRKFRKYGKTAVKAGAAIVGIAGAAALASAGDAFGADAYEYLKKRSKRRR